MSLAGRVFALEREVAELRQIVERLSLQLEESESSPFSVVREQAVGSGTSVPRPPSATSARADPALSFSPASRSSRHLLHLLPLLARSPSLLPVETC